MTLRHNVYLTKLAQNRQIIHNSAFKIASIFQLVTILLVYIYIYSDK